MAKINYSKDMIPYVVSTTAGKVRFTGKYRKDLETNNWHYWEQNNGIVIHFRKEHIVYVEGIHIKDMEKEKNEKAQSCKTPE